MSQPNPEGADAKKQLRRAMGFWDVLLFNIATVLGPRWVAAAAHNGPSSVSLWSGVHARVKLLGSVSPPSAHRFMW